MHNREMPMAAAVFGSGMCHRLAHIVHSLGCMCVAAAIVYRNRSEVKIMINMKSNFICYLLIGFNWHFPLVLFQSLPAAAPPLKFMVVVNSLLS